MPRKSESDAERAKRYRAEAAEKLRLALKAEKAEAERLRDEDTRRKILAGSWALAQADNLEFAERMRRELDRFWLVRDDDRRLFGFPVLSEADKAIHPNYEKTRRGGRKAGASAALSDGFADAPASSIIHDASRNKERETEDA